MKTCDEMVNSLLERRAQYVSAQKKRKKVLVSAATSVSAVALVSLTSFALYKNDVFRDVPPLSIGDATTTTTVTNTPTKTKHTITENDITATTDGGVVNPVTTVTTDVTWSQITTGKTQSPTATTAGTTRPSTSHTVRTEPSKTNPTQPTASQTNPVATQTQPTQTTPTTQPTVTDPSYEDPVEPMPEWPYLWIIYESGENYANGEVPIYFKLEGFEEVPFDWVKETFYTANGFSITGDISVERDTETGAIIYRMVLAYDGVTPKPSFFFSVVTADGMKQTAGLYGYQADHGFFVSHSYDSAFSSSVYYLVKTGVITHDDYQAIMEKYWSESVNGSMSWS
ncbi:MAG: hypothetical protein IJN04_05560 [Clostridia bacterium]|nr:hypothetical protein [Clostridia bacterium]